MNEVLWKSEIVVNTSKKFIGSHFVQQKCFFNKTANCARWNRRGPLQISSVWIDVLAIYIKREQLRIGNSNIIHDPGRRLNGWWCLICRDRLEWAMKLILCRAKNSCKQIEDRRVMMNNWRSMNILIGIKIGKNVSGDFQVDKWRLKRSLFWNERTSLE